MKVDAMVSIEENGGDLITTLDGANTVSQTVSNVLGKADKICKMK